ncbi:hypothetical protein HPP92_006071 [Vanilla planifolia]|uniref:DUF1639 family protein n=1 Tax=Vanilla planifolia TaxID=51239 RepID=A0A835S0S4_VANPL|nr:hypothetical protein HPP92_006071 [Vanilla planifolia]
MCGQRTRRSSPSTSPLGSGAFERRKRGGDSVDSEDEEGIAEVGDGGVLPTRSADVERRRRRNSPFLFRKREIDEDVFALTGSRPRRRPKKRPRIVQRQLDAIFPGLWLSEITPESYRVQE